MTPIVVSKPVNVDVLGKGFGPSIFFISGFPNNPMGIASNTN